MVRLLIRLGLAAGVSLAIVGAYATYRIWDQGGRDERQPADAIIVLGAAQYDGVPSPVFRARLDHALDLWDLGLAPYFVVTGGNQPGDRTTEAAVARQYAIHHGVPAESILIENRGRNTVESLDAVKILFEDNGLTSGLFVSDPTHMLRVLRMAEDRGMTAWGSPTRTSPIEADGRRHWEATFHELGALALYFVAGEAPRNESAPGPTPAPEGSVRIRP